MKEAQFYKKLENKKVKCELCPRFCTILPGKKGNCMARKNIDGILYSIVYGKPCSIAVDPIEKKPFYHFHPGSRTLSVATPGCNLHCEHCQNWEISQADPEEMLTQDAPPEKLIEMAKEQNCQGISYTYTEPTIFYEYAYDTAKLAKKEGLYNCFVSNGMINTEPLKEISKYLDAMNVDFKGKDDFYKKICHGPGIEPIKNTIKNCKKFGIHLEVTNLLIPGRNDSEKDILDVVNFIKNEVGKDTPLHFSCFYPCYKMLDTPRTPMETVEKARDLAIKAGLEYVYVGNVYPGHKGENTHCPNCNELSIERAGFSSEIKNLKGKKCPSCGKELNIVI